MLKGKTMKFFIYGTLKRKCSNNHKMKEVQGKFLAEVKTVQRYPMFNLGEYFPYLQDTIGTGNFVKGELWEVPEDKTYILDHFEGVPTLYKKGTIDVKTETEVHENVNVYFITEEESKKALTFLELITEWR